MTIKRTDGQPPYPIRSGTYNEVMTEQERDCREIAQLQIELAAARATITALSQENQTLKDAKK